MINSQKTIYEYPLCGKRKSSKTAPPPKNEYQCAMCRNIYNKMWSDEEALEETKELFGNISKEDCVVVCDDCFQQIHPKREKNKEIYENWKLNHPPNPLSR